jgi:hypothetical protein
MISHIAVTDEVLNVLTNAGQHLLGEFASVTSIDFEGWRPLDRLEIELQADGGVLVRVIEPESKPAKKGKRENVIEESAD